MPSSSARPTSTTTASWTWPVLDSQGVTVLLGNGKGGFLPPVTYAAGLDPTGLTIADVNDDGKPDLIVGNAYGDILVLLNLGNGTFAPIKTPIRPSLWPWPTSRETARRMLSMPTRASIAWSSIMAREVRPCWAINRPACSLRAPSCWRT